MKRKYNIVITFEGNKTVNSYAEVDTPEDLINIYLNDKNTIVNNGERIIYFNKNKIMMLEAIEIKQE